MTFNVDQFEAAKRGSTAQLLFKCGRIVNEIAIERLRKKVNQPGLRIAHTHLFPHIDLAGTRLTDLAAKLGLTKQAVGQLVSELEAMGFLEKVPDPADGRAKLICFSQEGKESMFGGLALLGELVADLTEKIGRRKMAQLHGALTALEAALIEDGAAEALKEKV